MPSSSVVFPTSPIHEYFGTQVDLLLDSAATVIDRGAAT